jgi:hypothetical protein
VNKYGAKRTWSELCQRWFASKREAQRGEELRMLEMAGAIRGLKYQVRYVLSTEPKVSITIDFKYIIDQPWECHYIFEDVKGVLTRDFRTKLAWLKQKEGIEVQLIR